MADIRVLVVDDEPLIAEAHAQLVGRVPGFVVSDVVHDAAGALRRLRDPAAQPDLVLLDFNLPDVHGLEVCRVLRAGGIEVDVIAVTSTRDLGAVRSAASLGVVSYLLKPFAFAALRDKLERYAEFRRQLHGEQDVSAQTDIDRAFASLRGFDRAALPGGVTAETLDAVAHAVREAGAASAAEVAETCGVSRVTARRYLEHLADANVVARAQRHRGSGRPEIEYRWVSAGGG
ncbi:response regulator [Jatrophihabitans fulvus]